MTSAIRTNALELPPAGDWPSWDALEPTWSGRGRDPRLGAVAGQVVGLWWD